MKYEGSPSNLKRQFWILFELKIEQNGLNNYMNGMGTLKGQFWITWTLKKQLLTPHPN
jgi:hypothetical protein